MSRPELQVSPVVLIVMDGWGERPDADDNAVTRAGTPNLDRYRAQFPFTTIQASGLAVGLPEGQMGNSEVGHLNLGAGRVVYQDFTRINLAIEQGDFFENRMLVQAVERTKKLGSTLHLLGLLSDGGVHSHIDHIVAACELARRLGQHKVQVHAILDGRDTPPRSAQRYIEQLEAALGDKGLPPIASIVGRFYAMDRDQRWERIRTAYDLLVNGEGKPFPSALAALADAYACGENDEFVEPRVMVDADEVPRSRIEDHDGMLFLNFRSDRARQIVRALANPAFDGFKRARFPHIEVVCLTEYDETFDLPIAYPPDAPRRILAEELARHGIRQLHTAETEKYAHVTFFFNGGREEPFPLEERILVLSPKVKTYDLQPAMSAVEVTDKLLARFEAPEPPQVVILNFANTDMVGHTGIFAAAVQAVQTVDACVGRIVEKVRALGGEVLITADHGNAEQMSDPVSHQPQTAHTCNHVPCYYIGSRPGFAVADDEGKLADIAPTLLDLLGLPKPEEMTGRSLLHPGVG